MFHSKLKETLNHSIAKVTSDRDFLFLIRKRFLRVRELLRSRLFCPLSSYVNPLPSVNSWIFQMSADAFYIRLKSKMLPETLETLIVFCTVFLKYKGGLFGVNLYTVLPPH